MTLLVNDSNFEEEVLKSDLPVLVDFFADWCGPCRMISPLIEELAQEYEGKMKICKANVDNAQALATQYGVSSIPTVVFFKNGEQVDQFKGALPKENIEEYIKKYLA